MSGYEGPSVSWFTPPDDPDPDCDCAICGCAVYMDDGDAAEMYDPKDPSSDNEIVHQECGLSVDWELA